MSNFIYVPYFHRYQGIPKKEDWPPIPPKQDVNLLNYDLVENKHFVLVPIDQDALTGNDDQDRKIIISRFKELYRQDRENGLCAYFWLYRDKDYGAELVFHGIGRRNGCVPEGIPARYIGRGLEIFDDPLAAAADAEYGIDCWKILVRYGDIIFKDGLPDRKVRASIFCELALDKPPVFQAAIHAALSTPKSFSEFCRQYRETIPSLFDRKEQTYEDEYDYEEEYEEEYD